MAPRAGIYHLRLPGRRAQRSTGRKSATGMIHPFEQKGGRLSLAGALAGDEFQPPHFNAVVLRKIMRESGIGRRHLTLYLASRAA